MKLRDYQAGDRVKARADFAAAFEAAGGVLPEGPRFTLLADDGAVRGIGGFKPLGVQQVGAWAYLAALGRQEWVQAAALARVAIVREWAQGADVYATPADTDAARRLLAWIGFRPSVDDAGVWKFEYHAQPARRAA